jgi:hypothetical protein
MSPDYSHLYGLPVRCLENHRDIEQQAAPKSKNAVKHIFLTGSDNLPACAKESVAMVSAIDMSGKNDANGG